MPADSGDDAEVDPLRFQHRALLDVELQERLDVVALGLGKPPGIAADLGDAGRERLAGGDALKPVSRQHAGDGARADAGDAKNRHFLGEAIDHFEVVVERDAALLQRARDLEAGDDPGDPVETAAVGHRVGMRSDDDRAAASAAARAAGR